MSGVARSILMSMMRMSMTIRNPRGEKGYIFWRNSIDEIITCRKGDFQEFSKEDEEEEEVEAKWKGW